MGRNTTAGISKTISSRGKNEMGCEKTIKGKEGFYEIC